MSREDVQLAWALVAGRLAHISEFRDIPRGSRPTAVCPLCRGAVTMKLGPKRAHHYAHRPDNDCSLQNPETAQHFNTKYLLASKLRSADILSVVAKCAWSNADVRCTNDLRSVASEGWDEVRVEHFVDPLRPDILLLKGGAAAFAIEVRATHAVPDMKAAKLADLGIPWVEVDAGGDWDEWEPSTSMPVIRHESGVAPRLCSAHLESARAQSVPSANASGRREVHPATHSHPDGHGERWRFRVVDCYPYQGPRVRKVFSVYCMDLESGAVRMRLLDDDQLDSFVIVEVCASSRSTESLRTVHAHLARHLKRNFVHFDSPRRWLRRADFPDNLAEMYSADFMPVKYRRDDDGVWQAFTGGSGY